MMGRGISETDLAAFEAYLQSLLDRFYTVHGDSNIQIFFTLDKWGFVDDGELHEIGNFEALENWLRNHCDGCSTLWEAESEESSA